MPELRFRAWAPSNIALIKYMGKKDATSNLPENGSLSMTLDSLRTVVELTCAPGEARIQWVAESPRVDLESAKLNEKGITKLVRHVERVCAAVPAIFARHGLNPASRGSETWTFRTANTFPQGSGIASSASAFAAITLAAAAACAQDRAKFDGVWKSDSSFRAALARIARQGSGSSCRSLDGPFVFWEGEDVSVVSSDLPKLAHFVVLVSSAEKQISSSEAHLRVKTSPLWNGRVQRVQDRLARLREAIAKGDLPTVARVAWAESWEMHGLFHTANPPFSYWEPGSVAVLRALAPAMDEAQPPIVTMDAGPNVHVIVDEVRASEWESRLNAIVAKLGDGARLLKDRQGTGGALG